MAKHKSSTTSPQNSAQGATLILEFANDKLTPEASRKQVTPLFNSKDLVQDILTLTQEDQAKLIDKVDQVCKRGWLAFV